MALKPEPQLRVSTFARLSGYSEGTIRHKLRLGKIAFRKTGGIVTIPESELTKILGPLKAAK